MGHMVNAMTSYVWGGGHNQATWNQSVTLSDYSTAWVPSQADCSGAVICAWENADPGCTGGASYTGDMRDCFLSTTFYEVTRQPLRS